VERRDPPAYQSVVGKTVYITCFFFAVEVLKRRGFVPIEEERLVAIWDLEYSLGRKR
jgi:hypothetical protein